MTDFIGNLPLPLQPKLPNPLLRGNRRNSLCPCESGKKFKNCHLPLLESMVPIEKFLDAKVFLGLLGKVK